MLYVWWQGLWRETWMGMAEEIIAEPNYEKLCSNILNCNEHVRFAGFVNDKSQI